MEGKVFYTEEMPLPLISHPPNTDHLPSLNFHFSLTMLLFPGDKGPSLKIIKLQPIKTNILETYFVILTF